MLLTPLRTCPSFAMLACLPTRPPLLRLRTIQSLVQRRFSCTQPHAELFSEQYRAPPEANYLSRNHSSLTSETSQAIQTP
jgi:hypothetical protein